MTAPSRCWSFTLRTLFVVVMAMGALTGWLRENINHVRQREDFLDNFTARGGVSATYLRPLVPHPQRPMPLVWRLLGAGRVDVFFVPDTGMPEQDRESIRVLFPEAYVDPISSLTIYGTF